MVSQQSVARVVIDAENVVSIDYGKFILPYVQDILQILESYIGSRQGLSVLVLGCGGGIIPSWLQSRYNGNVKVDVVEIDKIVLQAAAIAFGFRLGNGVTTHCTDAVEFVAQAASQDYCYDIVVVDVFDDLNRIPSVILTSEFLKILKSLISEDNGLFVMNYVFDEEYGEPKFNPFSGAKQYAINIEEVKAQGFCWQSQVGRDVNEIRGLLAQEIGATQFKKVYETSNVLFLSQLGKQFS
eukprot:TRINITY_DN23029_c2_g1_i1.p1 TRINITY_DN23029_c2_g1~~TRINITY_DN23029_c2_g1_i1.p1  ORF type:complete len:240 (-),score=32.83 TRINITY_DN23029_c2_g1_i1:195-914(-)